MLRVVIISYKWKVITDSKRIVWLKNAHLKNVLC